MQVHPHPIPADQTATLTPRGQWLRKSAFVVVLVAAIAGAVFFRDQLSFDTLSRNHEALIAFRDAHYWPTVAGFMLAYFLIVALSLPGGTVSTLTGGFLFGVFPGVLFCIIAASLGAITIFLIARAGYGAKVGARIEASGGRAARLQAALRENEWSVLMLMRLVPAVPFVVANLLPAFVGVRVRSYVVTTFLGITPAALVFTSVGAGLGSVFAAGATPDLSVIFTAPVLLPLLGLAVLASLPILLRLARLLRRLRG